MGASSGGKFALVLHSHIPYVLDHGKWPHGTDWLVEAAAECYLPLLGVLDRLVEDGISPRVTVGLTPVLVEQLSDPSFADELVGYLEQRCDAARTDALAFRRASEPAMAALANHWLAHYTNVARHFRGSVAQDIVSAFARMQDAGHIEVITSAATHGYLPLLGTDACVRAQVRAGVDAYRKRFGRAPTGFWLPECAYRPRYRWQPPLEEFHAAEPTLRRGVEEVLAEEGLRYFYVDAHLLEGGEATGAYVERFGALEVLWKRFATEWEPQPGRWSTGRPYAVATPGCGCTDEPAVAVFARDRDTGIQVWSGQIGYPGDEWYLEFHRTHHPGRLRYWRVSWPRDDLGAKELYDPIRALQRLPDHARHFADLVQSVLARSASTDGTPVVTSMYDTELFGHWWWEGSEWLYYAIRRLHEVGVERVTSSQALDAAGPLQPIALPEGSWGEGGYHWVWLNEWNAWTWELVYRCEQEMTRLADQFGDDARVRELLSQAARELLLLESSDWAFNISTWSARDYAEARARHHADAFEAISALVREVAEGEAGRPELWCSYREAVERDRCFADLDPRWWRSVGEPA